MQRNITKNLLEWKEAAKRKPLILRGARQVGKTWAIKHFSEKYYSGNLHLIDFEKHPDIHIIFEKNLDVNRIVSELELFMDIQIRPGEDLLFFDEIQSCPKAIMALRYFYEEMPQLHLIAAGSLLEFALKEISFPVGRVQFLDLYPMSFSEYLKAIGKNRIAGILDDGPAVLADAVHRVLLDEVKNYFFVGGMPECVQTYSVSKKLRDVKEIQDQLIDTYRQDFSKYAPYSNRRCLNSVLTTTAKSVGQQIIYSKLAPGFSSPTNKKAFDLLALAKLINPVYSASAAGLPFGASTSLKRFKAIFVDIGLMGHLCGVNKIDEYSKSNLLSIFRGAMAEQFVGQELLSTGTKLFYWSRAAKSSTAEIDYLLSSKGIIFPVEVKSGASGSLKSMHLLLKQHPQIYTGYVLSGAHHSELKEQKLKFIPLYYASNFLTYK